MIDTSHHTRRHHRNKKGSDPFLELSGEIDAPTHLPSVAMAHKDATSNGKDSDSLFADVGEASLTIIRSLGL